MSKIQITKKEYEERCKKDEPVLRSCWKCNSAHKHLKNTDYLIYCLWCGKLYLKGKEVEILGGRIDENN